MAQFLPLPTHYPNIIRMFTISTKFMAPSSAFLPLLDVLLQNLLEKQVPSSLTTTPTTENNTCTKLSNRQQHSDILFGLNSAYPSTLRIEPFCGYPMSMNPNHCVLHPLPGVCTKQYYLVMISPKLNPFALKVQITSEPNAILTL